MFNVTHWCIFVFLVGAHIQWIQSVSHTVSLPLYSIWQSIFIHTHIYCTETMNHLLWCWEKSHNSKTNFYVCGEQTKNLQNDLSVRNTQRINKHNKLKRIARCTLHQDYQHTKIRTKPKTDCIILIMNSSLFVLFYFTLTALLTTKGPHYQAFATKKLRGQICNTLRQTLSHFITNLHPHTLEIHREFHSSCSHLPRQVSLGWTSLKAGEETAFTNGCGCSWFLSWLCCTPTGCSFLRRGDDGIFVDDGTLCLSSTVKYLTAAWRGRTSLPGYLSGSCRLAGTVRCVVSDIVRWTTLLCCMGNMPTDGRVSILPSNVPSR